MYVCVGDVDVRVSLNGDSFTTTSQKFAFFPVTNGANCIMFGPGLLSNCAIKEEVLLLFDVVRVINLESHFFSQLC